MRTIILAIALTACGSGLQEPSIVVTKTPEIPAPTPVAPATVDDKAACVRLKELGCPEAYPRRGICTDAFANARADRIVVPVECFARAADVGALRACGDVSTMRVTCVKP